jgi:hypothetical protein
MADDQKSASELRGYHDNGYASLLFHFACLFTICFNIFFYILFVNNIVSYPFPKCKCIQPHTCNSYIPDSQCTASQLRARAGIRSNKKAWSTSDTTPVNQTDGSFPVALVAGLSIVFAVGVVIFFLQQ